MVRRESDGFRYLVLRAYRYWDFPKGLVEPGEDPLQSAKRETEEETTLQNLSFNWGNAWRETDVYANGKVARYYLAETADPRVALPVTEELGRPEHDEFRWVSYSAARALLSPRVLPVLEWAQSLVTGWRTSDPPAAD